MENTNQIASVIASTNRAPFTKLGFGCGAPKAYDWHLLPTAFRIPEPSQNVICYSVRNENIHQPNFSN